MTSYSVPFGRRCEGSVRLPPSKSVTNRALNLALLAESPITVLDPLRSDDIEAFLEAGRRLGVATSEVDGGVRLEPGERPASAEIDCGASGTMARFMTGTLVTLPGDWRLDGTERLRDRPLAPLIEGLRQLGARIECAGKEGFLPLRIRGGELSGGAASVDASASSQFLSALLMAATRASGPVELAVSGLASAPYVDLTLLAMRDFGADVSAETSRYRVGPGLSPPESYRVEGDLSSAGYFAAAAALAGGRVVIQGARVDSAQGDRRLFQILEQMGAGVEWAASNRLVVTGSGALQGVDVDMSDLPDQVPTLAAIAPFAEGRTRIHNVAHLRIKESDRLAACAAELQRLGARVQESEAALEIEGSWHDASPPDDPVEIRTYDDHRIAMSFAVTGLRRPGLRIVEPAVVGKSYPAFWEDFESCLET